MSLMNTNHYWGSVAKAFHWLLAILVIEQLISGWIAYFEIGSETYRENLYLLAHMPVGLAIGGLVIFRVLWRFANERPALPLGMKPWQRLLVNGSHTYMYIAMILMPLSGWIGWNFYDTDVDFFGYTLPRLVPPAEPAAFVAADVHFFLAIGLVAVFVLHIAGALRHHFHLRDAVLNRMMPSGWMKRRGPRPAGPK